MKSLLPRQQGGFTLIELLIALGVMAVFALLAYRGLDSVMRLHQGAYAHEQQAQAIDRVITQLEADLRQASSVKLLRPSQDGSEPRLQLQRRVEGDAGSELAMVSWAVEGTTLLRRTTLASGVQTAELLTQVSAATWLMLTANTTGAPTSWQAVTLAQIAALPNQSLDVQRGLGLRLTTAGKPLEKLFLVGR
jgi:prepilin-type N-terminal cleavage/methylation domain-containing protein